MDVVDIKLAETSESEKIQHWDVSVMDFPPFPPCILSFKDRFFFHRVPRSYKPYNTARIYTYPHEYMI